MNDVKYICLILVFAIEDGSCLILLVFSSLLTVFQFQLLLTVVNRYHDLKLSSVFIKIN